MRYSAMALAMIGIALAAAAPAAPILAGDSASPFGAPSAAAGTAAPAPAPSAALAPLDDDDPTSDMMMIVKPAPAPGNPAAPTATPVKPGAIVITDDDLKKEMADSAAASGDASRSGQPPLRQRSPSSARGGAVENIETGELLLIYEPIEIEEHSTSVKATVVNNSRHTLEYWRIGLNFDKGFNRSVGYSAAAGSRLAPKGEAKVSFLVTYEDKLRGKTSVDKRAVIEEVYILNSRNERINVTSYFKLKER